MAVRVKLRVYFEKDVEINTSNIPAAVTEAISAAQTIMDRGAFKCDGKGWVLEGPECIKAEVLTVS